MSVDANPRPRVSIGLPVYNGERYLAPALESLLAQQYTDFELVISDNSSTDRTEEICREFAARDPRVRYIRSPENRGGAWNWRRVFELSRGEYFKWAAHDDLYDPSFLGKCVDALDRDPSAVLAFTRTVEIGVDGSIQRPRHFDLHTDSQAVHERFRYLVCIDHYCFHMFSLIRRAALAKTRLVAGFIASDRVLIAQLGLMGRFADIPEELYLHRNHERFSAKDFPLHARMSWFDPERARKIRFVFPYWRILTEYARVVLGAELGWLSKLMCLLQIARWWVWNWRSAWSDVSLAARHIAGIGRNPYVAV